MSLWERSRFRFGHFQLVLASLLRGKFRDNFAERCSDVCEIIIKKCLYDPHKDQTTCSLKAVAVSFILSFFKALGGFHLVVSSEMQQQNKKAEEFGKCGFSHFPILEGVSGV